MKFKVGITPDVKMTFGNLIFMGLDREKKYFDRDKGERTDKLESRIYNLASSVQREQLEVEVPEYIDLKEIDFQAPVELKNPTISARAQSNGNFANVIWSIKAEDIIEVGKNSSVKKDSSVNVDKK